MVGRAHSVAAVLHDVYHFELAVDCTSSGRRNVLALSLATCNVAVFSGVFIRMSEDDSEKELGIVVDGISRVEVTSPGTSPPVLVARPRLLRLQR